MKKKITLVIILALLGGLYAGAVHQGFLPIPFKVTDPADPRFNPENFRFEDYGVVGDDIRAAIKIMFPLGTDKAYVEKVLIDAGGGAWRGKAGRSSIPNSL